MILTVTLNPAIDKLYQVSYFTVGSVFRPQKMWITAGGKGINVAKVASILGEQVVATGFLGGKNGEFIAEQLEQREILSRFVKISEDTRTCVAINDPVQNTSTEILEIGPTISHLEQAAFLDYFKGIIAEVKLIIISGSLPHGVPLEFYGKLMDLAKAQGKKVILDTSGETLTGNLAHAPYMIKPNREELEGIVGQVLSENQILEIASKIREDNQIEIVCVTLGGSGCIAITGEGTFRLHGPQVETINTVGSGDSFVAGCAVAFTRGLSMVEMLKTGMACGTANTQFAEAGKVSKRLVEQFLQQITVERY